MDSKGPRRQDSLLNLKFFQLSVPDIIADLSKLRNKVLSTNKDNLFNLWYAMLRWNHYIVLQTKANVLDYMGPYFVLIASTVLQDLRAKVAANWGIGDTI